MNRALEKTLMQENFADFKFFSLEVQGRTSIDLSPGARINLRSVAVAESCRPGGEPHEVAMHIQSANGTLHLLTASTERANTGLALTLNSLDAYREERDFRVHFLVKCDCRLHLVGDYVGHFIRL